MEQLNSPLDAYALAEAAKFPDTDKHLSDFNPSSLALETSSHSTIQERSGRISRLIFYQQFM